MSVCGFTMGVTPGKLIEKEGTHDPFGGDLNGLVIMKDGMPYSIYLRNGTHKRANCTLRIEGKDVGTYRLNPFTEYYVQRPVAVEKRFTFFFEDSPLDLSQAGISPSMKGKSTNGLLEAVFVPERAWVRGKRGRRRGRRTTGNRSYANAPSSSMGHSRSVMDGPHSMRQTLRGEGLRQRGGRTSGMLSTEEDMFIPSSSAGAGGGAWHERERQQEYDVDSEEDEGFQEEYDDFSDDSDRDDDDDDEGEGEASPKLDPSQFQRGMTGYSGDCDQEFQSASRIVGDEAGTVAIMLKLVGGEKT